MHFPQDSIAQTMAFVKPVMEPLVDASGYTFPLSLAEHSLWVGANTEIKNLIPRPRLHLGASNPIAQPLRQRERNVLFNDALNTFYLRLYGVIHMVKDHSDSEKGNPLPPHGLLFPINSKVLLYAPSHRQDSTYHGFCYTSRGALAGTSNSSMGPPHEGSIQRPIAP